MSDEIETAQERRIAAYCDQIVYEVVTQRKGNYRKACMISGRQWIVEVRQATPHDFEWQDAESSKQT